MRGGSANAHDDVRSAYGTFPASRSAPADERAANARVERTQDGDRQVRVKRSEFAPFVNDERVSQTSPLKPSRHPPGSSHPSPDFGDAQEMNREPEATGTYHKRVCASEKPVNVYPGSINTPLWRKLLFWHFDELLKSPDKIFDPASDVRWKLANKYKSVVVSEELRERYVRQGKSLGRAIFEMEGRQILICGGVSACHVLVTACVPWILLSMMTQVMGDPSFTMSAVWVKLFLFYACFVLETVCGEHESFHECKGMLRVVSSLEPLVFESAIASPDPGNPDKERITDIVNMFDVCAAKIGCAIGSVHQVWSRIVMVSVELYVLLQVSQLSLMLVSITIVSMSITLLLAVVAAAYPSQKWASKHNEILNTIHECFKGIRMVKLNAWEWNMQEKIEKECEEEDQLRRNRDIASAVLGVPCINSSQLFSIVVFSAMAAKGNAFMPVSVFTALILFQRINARLFSIAQYSARYLEVASSLKMIDKFLRARSMSQQQDSDLPKHSKSHGRDTDIAIQNGCFTHGAGNSTLLLVNVNVNIRRGQLVVVHGKSGTGKSTLLRLMIKEIKPVNGDIFVKGDSKIAYCPQEPWLQTLSIKDNVLFGSKYDEAKYLCVLDACCLLEDLKILPCGDMTLVGPKGVNLSGGQKSRIALARACYSDADIYLLDCPFASVDAIVQSDIFRKCILELLRLKTVVFATHNPEFVRSRFIDQSLETKDMSVAVSESTENVSRRVSEMACVAPWKQQGVLSSRFECSSGGLSLWTLDTRSTSGYLRSMDLKPTVKDTSSTAIASRMELVSYDTFRDFFYHRNTLWSMAFTMIAVACGQLLLTASDLWLVTWSSGESSYNSRNSSIVYGALIGASAVFQVLSRVFVSAAFLHASNRFFRKMTKALLEVPMTFFYSTPLGEIMYRYFVDMVKIDEPASLACLYFLRSATSLCCRVGVIWYFMGAAGIAAGLIAVFALTAVFPHGTYVRMQQAEFVNQWKLLNFVSEAFDGALTIRAFGAAEVERFCCESGALHDSSTESVYFSWCFNSFVVIRTSLMFGMQLLLVGFVLATHKLPPAALGLVLYYIIKLEEDVMNCATGVANGLVALISASRARAYGQIETERSFPATFDSIQPPLGWPSKGTIVFDQVSFGYSTNPSEGTALHNVSCTVTGGQKIGVVGRTGSGKSSVAMALFRLHPMTSGHIVIDGIDTRFLDLKTLRSRLSIIPEMPMFYRCSVRYYLDPFSKFGDNTLWSAIHKCGLQKNVTSLDQQLWDNGENWSVGERQILCLVRALLKPSRILILDEAFSALDQVYAAKLLAILESSFAHSTVFMISHRLDQMLHFDKIMVLGEGKLLEFGSAVNLAGDPHSAFYEFLETTSLTY